MFAYGNMFCSISIKNGYKHFENLKGVAVYIYDIIVGGTTEKEHDEGLHRALERLHLYGEICVFKQRQINYLGELKTKNDVYPDSEKVYTMAEMKAPSDKAELQRMICMIYYVGRLYLICIEYEFSRLEVE